MAFKDIGTLSNFIDNHDVKRVMNQLSTRFKENGE
jgi:hypothetical protein